MTNKEFGSDFHYINDSEYTITNSLHHYLKEVDCYFSGRAGLRSILLNGIQQFSWKKIYVPTYYCHEVYTFIKDLDIEIEYYQVNPEASLSISKFDDKENHVLLVVNYFGLTNPNIEFDQTKMTIIEDLTHDLSRIHQSTADYVFGSLRKILPLPVGGFVKSKNKVPYFPATSFGEEVSLEKFTGMVLKKKYLQGQFSKKDIFRDILITAEHSFEKLDTFGALPKVVVNYLQDLDIQKIIASKKENSFLIKSLIKENSYFRLLTSDSNAEFALILKFDHPDTRNQVRQYLIEHSIYPIVLWPDQFTEADIMLQDKLLFVHIDFRYSSEDIHYIAQIINQSISNV